MKVILATNNEISSNNKLNYRYIDDKNKIDNK